MKTPPKIWPVSVTFIIVLISLRFFVLNETTQLWGNPLLAAQVWSEEHPRSPRAVQFLTVNLDQAGRPDLAREATIAGHRRIRSDIHAALQSVYLSCNVKDRHEFESLLNETQATYVKGYGGRSVFDLLDRLVNVKQKGGCPYLPLDALMHITDVLLSNPHLAASGNVLTGLHIIRYRIYALQGLPDQSIQELLAAFNLSKVLSLATTTATVIHNAGHHADALSFLDDAMKHAPKNPILRQRWLTEINKLKASMNPATIKKHQTQ